MKYQIIRHGIKIIVKFDGDEPSQKLIRKIEKQIRSELSYCDFRNGKLILWNGASNVNFAGFYKLPKRLRKNPLGWNRFDSFRGKTRMIVRQLQSDYSKLRYSRQWPKSIYEALIRTRANGSNVMSDFTAPKLP